MSKAIKNFEDALQRLIDRKPTIVTHPYSINNDTVALEAGRKRGAIKKSRPELAELLVAIAEAESRRIGQNGKDKADVRDIKRTEAKEKIKQLEAELAEVNEKYQAQKAQIAEVSYRNLQLHRELQGFKQSNNNLLDFMKN